MRHVGYILILIIYSCKVNPVETHAHAPSEPQWMSLYTEAQLRGSNTQFRNWWNVLRYDIVLEPNYADKSLQGTVTTTIEVIADNEEKVIQIDLQHPMEIVKIVELVPNALTNTLEEFVIHPDLYQRLGHKYFLQVADLRELSKGEFKLKFYFEGQPKIAKNAPWDGGWIFTEDDKGRPWMSAAVQGLGASSWFPCKDYQGDEPDDGVSFTLIVPEDLVAVSNGRLWKTSMVNGEAGTNVYTWEVKNPINSYNIIPYIGHYENFSDTYQGLDGTLSLDYWVLDYNVDKAKSHFEQVGPMLTAFEDWMGPYPFYQDGFKLVESPYLGMEHQSAIAYGNRYGNGYLGMDRTRSGFGNKFDFIIVHEAGHEWFGNSITSEDVADLWIHEGFTTYAEAMYVENRWGIDAANLYIQGLYDLIQNEEPIIGTYGEHSPGSRDMYYKGAALIHTIRQLMQDDVAFKQMMKAMNKQFFHSIVTTKQIENFILEYTNLSLEPIFDQYLRTTKIPKFETKTENGQTMYRWSNVIEGFEMHLRLHEQQEWIQPTTEWQVYHGDATLIPDPNFYIQY